MKIPTLYLHVVRRFLLAEQSTVSSENLDVAQKRSEPRISLFRENPRERSRPMIACKSERKGDSSWELKIRHEARGTPRKPETEIPRIK